MKLKTFRAASMPLALAQVKRHYGNDAVIINTRTFTQGGLLGLGGRKVVEITARPSAADSDKPYQLAHHLRRAYVAGMTDSHPVEKKAEDINSPLPDNLRSSLTFAAAPAPDYAGYSGGQLQNDLNNIRSLVEDLVRDQRKLHAPQMPAQLFDFYLQLIQREVADEIARELLNQVSSELTGNQLDSIDLVRQKVIVAMDKLFDTSGPICLNLDGSARVVALIGPTGVGKTTTIAKLAADFKLRRNKEVGLITIDTYRIGAVDQLRMYAQIIDVPLKVVLTPAELAEAVEMMRDKDIILIDTAGRSQNDELRIQELKSFLNAARPDEVHLVLSGIAHQSHMLSAAEKFGALGVNRIILTKLDEAISFGVILSVLRKFEASISYITTGQNVPDDIEVGSGRLLAQRLLGLDPSGNSAADAVSQYERIA